MHEMTTSFQGFSELLSAGYRFYSTKNSRDRVPGMQFSTIFQITSGFHWITGLSKNVRIFLSV